MAKIEEKESEFQIQYSCVSAHHQMFALDKKGD